MPALVMSHLFMCVCIVAGVSPFDAHTALEWAVQEGHIREDGYIKTDIDDFAYQMATQFHTIPHFDYEIKNTSTGYQVLDSNGQVIFDPDKRFESSALFAKEAESNHKTRHILTPIAA